MNERDFSDQVARGQLSDIFGSPPTVQQPQWNLQVPLGYGVNLGQRPPPLGQSLLQGIMGGPGQPGLRYKPTELPQPGLMFRMNIPF